MRPLRRPALYVALALSLLAACRDAAETLVGPPPDAASLSASVLSARRGAALDVNDASVTAGWVEGNRAVRWARGKMQVLGTLGGNYSRAAFINAAGHVAGTSTTPDGTMHVFVWTAAGGMRDLGTLGGSSITVAAFSDSGHVAGWGTKQNGTVTGFLAREGRPLQLIAGYPADVNGAGLVVGRMGPSASPAFRWTPSGGMQSLPAPWNAAAWESVLTNEAGVVAGVASGGGKTRAVRWIPTGGYQEMDCGEPVVRCMGPTALNERGDVAWAVTTWNPPAEKGTHVLQVWEPSGEVRRISLDVVPDRLVMNDEGIVAGTGHVIHTYTTYRSFLWRPAEGIAYYRASTQLYALNARGEAVGTTVGGSTPKLWNDRPTWFGTPENHAPRVTDGRQYQVQAGDPLQLHIAQVATDADGDFLRAYWGGFPDRCCWRRLPPTPSRSAVTYQWNVPGDYAISYTVADADSLHAHGSARVRVMPRTAGGTPRLRAFRAVPGELVQLDGRRPDDPTGETYSYAWSFDRAERRALLHKSFPADGTYDFSLEVHDAAGGLVEIVHTRAVILSYDPIPAELSAPTYMYQYEGFWLGLFGIAPGADAVASFACGRGGWTEWQPATTSAQVSCPGLPQGRYWVGGRLRRTSGGPVTEYGEVLEVGRFEWMRQP